MFSQIIKKNINYVYYFYNQNTFQNNRFKAVDSLLTVTLIVVSVIFLCFVVRYFMSILVLQSS